MKIKSCHGHLMLKYLPGSCRCSGAFCPAISRKTSRHAHMVGLDSPGRSSAASLSVFLTDSSSSVIVTTL